MIKINDYANKFLNLPRPSRRETELLIKEIYEKGRNREKFAKIKIK